MLQRTNVYLIIKYVRLSSSRHVFDRALKSWRNITNYHLIISNLITSFTPKTSSSAFAHNKPICLGRCYKWAVKFIFKCHYGFATSSALFMVEINANTYLIFRRTDLSRLNFVALGLYGERPYDFSISRVPTSADRALKSWRHDTVVKRSVGLNKPSFLVATRIIAS